MQFDFFQYISLFVALFNFFVGPFIPFGFIAIVIYRTLIRFKHIKTVFNYVFSLVSSYILWYIYDFLQYKQPSTNLIPLVISSGVITVTFFTINVMTKKWSFKKLLMLLILLVLFVPKDAGYRHYDIGGYPCTGGGERYCKCIGIESWFLANRYCYGIPHSCQEFSGCEEKSPFYNK